MAYHYWPLVAAVALTIGCGTASADPLPLTPGYWTIGPIINSKNKSSGVTPMPNPAREGQAWKFTFPTSGVVGYITTPRTLSIAGKTLRMCFDIVGPGTFKAKDGSPAFVRLYFQKKRDNWSGTGVYEDYRWWSTKAFAAVEVKDGVCVSSDMNVAAWSQVMGKPASARMAEFNSATLNVDNVGFTFGGKGYGHGVYATSGTPKFILREFSIN